MGAVQGWLHCRPPMDVRREARRSELWHAATSKARMFHLRVLAGFVAGCWHEFNVGRLVSKRFARLLKGVSRSRRISLRCHALNRVYSTVTQSILHHVTGARFTERVQGCSATRIGQLAPLQSEFFPRLIFIRVLRLSVAPCRNPARRRSE